MTDVIVTVEGRSQETIRAIRAGGGLVGTRSAFELSADLGIEFVDWPFVEDQQRDGGFPVDEHLAAVRRHSPRYAVAPDIEEGRSLDEVVGIADDLAQHAETVIVVPKEVPPGAVPSRFRIGVPFRDGFSTNLGTNTFSDFDGLPNVHVLGGNPNKHFELRDRHRLDVRSVDTPLPLSWANFGRVFVGGGAGGVEVNDLTFDRSVELTDRGTNVREIDLTTRAGRVEFSVQKMVEAWTHGVITYEFRPTGMGQGPPPVTEDMIAGEPDPEERERLRRQQERAGEMQESRTVGTAPREVVEQDRLDCIPEEIVRDDRATKVENEGADVEGAESTDDKRSRFRRLQDLSESAVEQAGLGEFQLPDREEEDG